MAWLPAVISGTASLIGGRERNRAASAQAARQMEFQERMSSSAHQREVADLRAAGLNPILSATGGRGASTPGGAMAPMQDILTPAVNSALAAKRLSQEIQNMRANQRLAIRQADAAGTQADLNRMRTSLVGSQDDVLSGPAALGRWIGDIAEAFDRNRARTGDWMREQWSDLTERLNPNSPTSHRRTNRTKPLRINIRRGRQPE